MPNGAYMSGLTVLDRRVLQTVLDVEKAGGAAAVNAVTLILAVDSGHTSWVAEQALAKSHWTLQPHQVVIVSIARCARSGHGSSAQRAPRAQQPHAA